MSDHGSPFWRFSLGVYGQTGVPEACLALQEESGADVNVALFVLWHASEGRELSADEVAAIDAGVAAWRREIVIPLRAVRQALKPKEFDPPVARLRQSIKKVELESERLQQESLFLSGAGLGTQSGAPVAAARGNLARYAALLGRVFPDQACEALISAATSDERA